MGIKSAQQTLRFLLNHPLNESHKLRAFKRYLSWQIGVRLLRQPVLVDFVNDSVLLIRKGEASSLVIHTGLFEYQEMVFVLHCLRKHDLFVDIGANVGVYTVLASAVVGCRCVSFEPIPHTYADLLLNIRLNSIGDLVHAVNAAVGNRNGEAVFTAGFRAENRYVSGIAPSKVETVKVRMVKLDDAIHGLRPKIVKVDVEGFETEVVNGGQKALADPGLLAVIMEFAGEGKRYGFDEGTLYRKMLDLGFNSCLYEPKKRELISTSRLQSSPSGNVLYVRYMDKAKELVKNGPRFLIRRFGTWI